MSNFLPSQKWRCKAFTEWHICTCTCMLAWYPGPFLPVIKCVGRAGKGPGSTSRVYAVPRNVQCWAIRSHHSVHNIVNKSTCNNGQLQGVRKWSCSKREKDAEQRCGSVHCMPHSDWPSIEQVRCTFAFRLRGVSAWCRNRLCFVDHVLPQLRSMRAGSLPSRIDNRPL